MLVAENHGKYLKEAHNHEDYLTSSVFGHLRCIPPSQFWSALIAETNGSTGEEPSLIDVIKTNVAIYTHLRLIF